MVGVMRAFLLAALCLGGIESAKILGLFHFPVRSQHVLGSYLLKELARRGHQVTMASLYPFDEPVANYTDIKVDNGLSTYMLENFGDMLKGRKMTVFDQVATFPWVFQDYGRLFLESPEIRRLLNSGAEFDLVIQLWNHNEAFLGISNHFKAPTIAFCSVGASTMINHLFSNPAPFSMVPIFFTSGTETFYDRLINTLGGFAFELLQQYYSLPVQTRLLKKNFPDAPPLQDLLDNVQVALMNSHPAVEGSKPYMPNMIQIGGFYIEKPEPLTKAFQDFLDGADENGVVLFSLGTNVKTQTFPKERIDAFFRVFGRLKQRVIFKFDGVRENIPKNVMISNWVPQTGILAHKNVKLFVTHAGLGGVAEGIYNAVPMVCIPFFMDQPKNCEDMVRNGYSIQLKIEDINEDNLYTAMMEAISNPAYKERLVAASDFYKAQPMKPLDKAIYWIEHVIKHKGAKHFPKSTGTKQSLPQYLLLDVIAFVIAILAVVYFVMKKIFQILGTLLIGRLGKSTPSKKLKLN